MGTLRQELERAHKELKLPPGATESSHQHAELASTLLSCLRYGGLTDDYIRDCLADGDARFVASWAVKFKRRRSPDAGQAAHHLDDLLHQHSAELHQAIALLTAALAPKRVDSPSPLRTFTKP